MNIEIMNNKKDANLEDIMDKSEKVYEYGNYYANEDIKEIKTFEELNLSSETLKGIYSIGFEKPSQIQQKAIRPLIDGRDLIVQSQSGTGKTATFLISCIERVNKSIKAPQIIILSPTRELAKQTYNVCNSLTKFHKDISVFLAIGGTSRNNISRKYSHLMKNKDKDDQTSHQIIVGTPGRICDIIQNKKINISNVKNIVLDEGDEMLSIGFYEQIIKIIKSTKTTTKIQLFSATIPVEMIGLIEDCNILKNPLKILVKQDELSLKGIQQYYVVIEEQDKYPALKELYEMININQSIIYCNSRKKVEILTNNMEKDNFPVKCITGDMSQEERNLIISEFRNGGLRVLITTDLLSRGLDIQQISLVLNYDMPKDTEVYLHRIGRGGRYGRKGVAINFSDFKNKIGDKKILKDIENFYSIKINELPADINSLFD